MLPTSSPNLWNSLMALVDSTEIKNDKNPKKPIAEEPITSTTSAQTYPVSRFGALLATSLLRLPQDTEYRIIEEYFPPPVQITLTPSVCEQETSAVLFYITSP